MAHPPNIRPLFVPRNVDFNALAPELQTAITAVINPAYRELVLGAPEGLEKSTGLSIVYLLWLEVLEQQRLAETWQTADDGGMSPTDRAEQIARHLRLVLAKVKVSSFLLRLRESRQRWGGMFAPPRDPHLDDPAFAATADPAPPPVAR
jgi:hypothetical protein